MLEAITLTHVERQEGFTEALTDNYQKLWVEGIHQANQASRGANSLELEDEALIGQLLG